jgi:thioredoxin reductase
MIVVVHLSTFNRFDYHIGFPSGGEWCEIFLEQLGVKLTERGNVWRDEHWMTSILGVFTAGDMHAVNH